MASPSLPREDLGRLSLCSEDGTGQSKAPVSPTTLPATPARTPPIPPRREDKATRLRLAETQGLAFSFQEQTLRPVPRL